MKDEAMAKHFIVHLSQKLIDAQQNPETKTIYRLAQKTGVTFNTVKKYIAGDVSTPYLTAEVMQLCEYFGLDWRDPAVVEEFTTPDSESPGQLKTLLTTA